MPSSRCFLAIVFSLTGCLAPQPPDGTVICASSGQQCPDGYYCDSGSNTCWKNGHTPSFDMASDLSMTMQSDLASSDDLSTSSDLSPPADLATPLKHQGDPCNSSSICDTGFCADGVCCNSACTDPCSACSLVNMMGTCSPVLSGATPVHGACATQSQTTCGTDGKCDGAGTCEKWPAGTQCAAANCDASNNFTPAAQCDGSGACKNNAPYSCAPYKCNGTTACFTSCTDSTQCSGTNPCISSSCGQVANGHACTSGSQCTSGNCVDSYCCNSACSGLCQSCNVPGSLGTCTTDPSGAPLGTAKSCSGTGTTCGGKCDGTNASACAYPGSTVQCNSACTAAGTETDYYCNGSGGCSTTGTAVNCAGGLICKNNNCLTSCGSSTDCQKNAPCSSGACVGSCVNGVKDGSETDVDCGGGTCPACPKGEHCGSNGDCTTLNCVDMVCCNSSCINPCQACNLAGSIGTCANIPGGGSPIHGSCPVQPVSSCGLDGKCDGSGNCRDYPSGTMCMSATCASGSLTPASQCSGSGTCVTPTAMSCAPYVCNGTTACYSSCTTNAQCSGSNSCVSSSCGLLSNGQACTSATQCTSGNCVDGYCCNSTCAGQCQACDSPSALGNCSTVTSGQPHGSRTPCTGAGTTCGGSCNGSSPTACGYSGATVKCNSSCKSSSVETDFACNGAGSCNTTGTDSSCSGGFACMGGACLTSCGSSTQCQTNFQCTAPNCNRIPESDCFNGVDDNGDGLVDCDDPTCNSIAECVPAAGTGTIGELTTGAACPTNFGSPQTVNQPPITAPMTCSGCGCSGMTSCKTDFYFDATTNSCSAKSASPTASLTYSSGQGPICASFSSSNPQSIWSATSFLGYACNGDNTNAKRDTSPISWTTTKSFCPIAKSSSNSPVTCSGKVCIPKTATPACVLINGLNAVCPSGYGPPSGSSANWYGATQYVDTRTCSCSCSPSGSCDSTAFPVSTSTGCPTANVGAVLSAGTGTTCASAGGFGWTNPIASIRTDPVNNPPASFACSTNGTVSGGSVTPSTTSGYTICCQ